MSIYFSDIENDTISFVNGAFQSVINMTMTAAGIVSGTPTSDDQANRSPCLLSFDAVDNHYSATSATSSSFTITIIANSAPSNSSILDDMEGQYDSLFTFTLPVGLFVDSNSDAMTYTYASTPDASAWLTLDNSTQTFSGTPTLSQTGNYSITITATDIHGAFGSTDTNLFIRDNKKPVVDQGLYNPVTNMSVFQQFEYTIPADAFTDFEGDTITYTAEVSPDDFTMTYNSGNMTVTGTPSDNTKFGAYTLSINARDATSDAFSQAQIAFEIFQNAPPSVDSALVDQTCFYAYNDFLYEIDKSASFSDSDGETITYLAATNNTSLDGWLSFTENTTHLIFSGTPTNAQAATYLVTLMLDDEFGDTDTTDSFTV